MMNLLMMVAALAAPALSSATATPTCGKWLSKLSIEGDLIKTVSKPDRFWCKKACMTMDGCEAATYVKSTKKCSLYKLDGDSMFHVNSKAESFVFCGTCNKMENHVDFEGEQLMRFQIKDAWWCRKKCMQTDGCNAMSFKASGGWCTLKHVLPEFKRSKKTGTKSYLFCDEYGVLPICDDGDIVANGVCDSPGPKCGKKGQPICHEGEACEPGLSTSSDAMCVCGGKWQTCCEGSCDAGLECDINGDNDFGQCAPCGGDANNDYQMCCGGDTCNQDDKRRVCLAGTGQRGCAPCGGMFQPVCANEPKCDGMNMPDPHGTEDNIQCVMTGSD